MKRKENILVIIFGVTLAIIIITIAMVGLNSKTNIPSNDTTKNQDLLLIYPTQKFHTAIQDYLYHSNPPVAYNQSAQKKLVDKIVNKQSLSLSDQTAKQKLITTIGNTSGTLYHSPQIDVVYLQSADFFQVEILTTDITTAKEEANIWFRSQGLSHQGICNLPVQFFINWNVANQLRNSNLIFNPLPENC